MSTKTLVRSVATLFVAIMMVPSVFFVAPPRAHAVMGILDTNLITDVMTAYTVVQSTISAVNNVVTAIATYAGYINTYILEPLAFVTSGNLVKSITASVIGFVNGKSNGTGTSQFIQNLQGHMQSVGDTQANAFFAQFGKNSNSPFAASINSSLRQNYYQQTSLAGFFAANKDTLPQYSKNPRAFLAGDWSQGGAGAWIALTTQPQNNPYMLHQRAQSELSRMVQDKTSARLAELSWGSGFLSWCGGTGAVDACDADGNAGTLSPDGMCLPNQAVGSTDVAVADTAGDSCIKKDGTPGTIQTPGSAIKDSLTKALGLTPDKVVAMGNASSQINSILSNIGKIMETINFGSAILGSASINGMTGGLAGASQTRPDGGDSYMDSYENSDGGFGLTPGDITESTSKDPAANGTQFLETVDKYETYWTTIRASADTAAVAVDALILYVSTNSCSAVTSSDAEAARAKVDAVLTQADTASTTVAKARAFVDKLRAEAVSDEPGSGGAYLADLQALQTMHPTASDMADAQQQAFFSDRAETDPPVERDGDGRKKNGPINLNVVDGEGTIVDRMTLIGANARKLKSNCNGLPY